MKPAKKENDGKGGKKEGRIEGKQRIGKERKGRKEGPKGKIK